MQEQRERTYQHQCEVVGIIEEELCESTGRVRLKTRERHEGVKGRPDDLRHHEAARVVEVSCRQTDEAHQLDGLDEVGGDERQAEARPETGRYRGHGESENSDGKPAERMLQS